MTLWPGVSGLGCLAVLGTILHFPLGAGNVGRYCHREVSVYRAVQPRIGEKSAEHDEACSDADEADRNVDQCIAVQTEDHNHSPLKTMPLKMRERSMVSRACLGARL